MVIIERLKIQASASKFFLINNICSSCESRDAHSYLRCKMLFCRQPGYGPLSELAGVNISGDRRRCFLNRCTSEFLVIYFYRAHLSPTVVSTKGNCDRLGCGVDMSLSSATRPYN